jgi:hypothetical protein
MIDFIAKNTVAYVLNVVFAGRSFLAVLLSSYSTKNKSFCCFINKRLEIYYHILIYFLHEIP